MVYIFRFLILFFATLVYADSNNMKLFPIENYSQNADMWINPSNPDYNTNLLDDDYQTPVFLPIISEIEKISGKKYHKDNFL